MKRDSDNLGVEIEETLNMLEPRSIDPAEIRARASRRRTRRRGALAGVAAFATLIVVVLASVGGPSGGPLSPPTVEASARVPLKGNVLSAASDGQYLWVLTCSTNCAGSPFERTARGSLVKVDSQSGAIVATVEIANPHLVAVGGGAVWTASFPDGVVSKFDPESLEMVGEVRFSLPKPIAPGAADARAFFPDSLVVGEGAVWVSTARQYVVEIDPDGLEVRRMISLSFSPAGMAVAGGEVLLSAGTFGIGGIDVKTGAVLPPQPIEDSHGYLLSADYLASANGSLWVRGAWSSPDNNGKYVPHPGGDLGMVHFDPGTAQVEQAISFDQHISVSAVSGSLLWLTGRDSPEGARDVYVLTPDAQGVELAARLAEPGVVIGAVGNEIWVARANYMVQRYTIPVELTE